MKEDSVHLMKMKPNTNRMLREIGEKKVGATSGGEWHLLNTRDAMKKKLLMMIFVVLYFILLIARTNANQRSLFAQHRCKNVWLALLGTMCQCWSLLALINIPF